MKRFSYYLLSTSLLFWGMSSCSSSKTENTEAVATETVTADQITSPTADTKDTVDAEKAIPTDTISFAVVAASSGLFEIRSSEQALTKANRQETKNFAQQMITEHQKANQELKTLLTAKNQRISTELLPEHQRMYSKLMAEDPKEFDDTYMELQVEAHREAVELFENAARSHQDAELRAFAERTLPNLRMHLESAKKIGDEVD